MACSLIPVAMAVDMARAFSARKAIVSSEAEVWCFTCRRISLRCPSSTDMNAFDGTRNCNIVASSEGRNADRTREVFALRGFPAPATISSISTGLTKS